MLSCRKKSRCGKWHGKEIKLFTRRSTARAWFPVTEALDKAGYKRVCCGKNRHSQTRIFPPWNPPTRGEGRISICHQAGRKSGSRRYLRNRPGRRQNRCFAERCKRQLWSDDGNQMGLYDGVYSGPCCGKNQLTSKDYIVKTIVTTDLTKKLQKNYGVRMFDVYTGFKFIAEAIKKARRNERWELLFWLWGKLRLSAGNLCQGQRRGCRNSLVCELVAVLKRKGQTLADAIQNIYKKYGCCVERTVSCGNGRLRRHAEMAALMEKVAADPFKKIGETEIVAFRNYNEDFRLDFATGKKSPLGLNRQMFFILNLQAADFSLSVRREQSQRLSFIIPFLAKQWPRATRKLTHWTKLWKKNCCKEKSPYPFG